MQHREGEREREKEIKYTTHTGCGLGDAAAKLMLLHLKPHHPSDLSGFATQINCHTTHIVLKLRPHLSQAVDLGRGVDFYLEVRGC